MRHIVCEECLGRWKVSQKKLQGVLKELRGGMCAQRVPCEKMSSNSRDDPMTRAARRAACRPRISTAAPDSHGSRLRENPLFPHRGVRSRRRERPAAGVIVPFHNDKGGAGSFSQSLFTHSSPAFCATRTTWRPQSSSLPRVRPSTDGPERGHSISARHPRKNQTDRGCAMEVLRPPAAGLAFSKIRRLTFAPQPGRPCHVTLPVRRQPLGLALAQSAAAASTALRRHPKPAVAALATSGRCR